MVSVVIPALNEAEVIGAVVRELPWDLIHECLVVDNGSTDATAAQALAAGARVITSPRGYGRACAAGASAADPASDILVFMDGDGSDVSSEMRQLLQPIQAGECDFVIGSRHSMNTRLWKIRNFNDAGGLAALFNFGHLMFLMLFNIIYRQRLSDPFSMFKVFRRECLYGLQFECNRFDFDFEIVIKLLRKGYRPIELPVTYRSRSFAEGKKVTVFRDPLTWLRALVKYRNSPLYDLSVREDVRHG